MKYETNAGPSPLDVWPDEMGTLALRAWNAFREYNERYDADEETVAAFDREHASLIEAARAKEISCETLRKAVIDSLGRPTGLDIFVGPGKAVSVDLCALTWVARLRASAAIWMTCGGASHRRSPPSSPGWRLRWRTLPGTSGRRATRAVYSRLSLQNCSGSATA